VHPSRHATRVGLASSLILISLLAVPVGPASSSTLAAAIALKPAVGPPTIPFSVQGLGFGSSETVDITFDATLLGHATTSPDGSFTKQVKAPRTADPGSHIVSATGETSGSTATATFLVRTNWPRFHFDNANTGFNSYENVISTSNVGTLVQKWSANVGGTWAPNPIVAYGRVYVASTLGIVQAFDAQTGAMAWSFNTAGTIANWWMVPTAANNLIYVGNDHGRVIALSASTGRPAWTVHLIGKVQGAPVVGGGVVYVNADNHIYALDAGTGATIWTSLSLNGPIHPPTLSSGFLYTEPPWEGCDISAWDAETGDLVWSRSFCSDEGGSITEAVAVEDGRVLATSDALRALDVETGSVLWTNRDVGGTSPSVANGVAYLAGAIYGDGPVQAVNAATGSPVWQTTMHGPSSSCPAVSNGVVYVGGADGLYAFDMSTGARLWTSPSAASEFDGSPAVSDGMVFASTADGTVYAFGLPSQEEGPSL
jgi:outer membrane protein assembly factor BamB